MWHLLHGLSFSLSLLQVLWQNLEVSPRSRLLRQTGVNLILLLLLLASFIAIIVAHLRQASFAAEVPQLETCNTVLPAIAYGVPILASGAFESA